MLWKVPIWNNNNVLVLLKLVYCLCDLREIDRDYKKEEEEEEEEEEWDECLSLFLLRNRVVPTTANNQRLSLSPSKMFATNDKLNM